ncbi:YolD-like protein [Streptococcus infantarius subsp. infantarius]|nr:YolD-like protein [Streptococcus infantarius subsp. infantarius]
MNDRSYLPFKSAREHKDRGMAKWMGFFLSEHTTSLDEDKNRVDLSSPLSKIEKLTLIGQLYSSRLTGRFVIKRDKMKEQVVGQVEELSSKEITVRTTAGYQLLQIDHILNIVLESEFEDE